MWKLEKAEKKELRLFGFVMATAAALMLGIVVPWLWSFLFPVWPWVVAGVLALAAAAFPPALKPVRMGWMRVGHGLNWLISRATLVLVYYVVVLPIGAVMRLAGRDPMRRDFERHVNTYRVPAERPDRKHLERPF